MPPSKEDAEARLKARKPIPKPKPAYLPVSGSPLAVDKDLYASIVTAPRAVVEEFVIPIRSGRAWKAAAGSIVRISTPEGPQVGMCRDQLSPVLGMSSKHRLAEYTIQVT